MSTAIEEFHPGEFDPDRHFYPRAQNAQIDPLVASFFRMPIGRLIKRYCHLHPHANADRLTEVMTTAPRYLRWSGSDIFNVSTEMGVKTKYIVETNSCPSGQKSFPILEEGKEEGGYYRLLERTFLPQVSKRLRKANDEDVVAVVYDKNPERAQDIANVYAAVMVADINIGFIFPLAVAGIGVYGVILGGWASNNKYSFLGGLRSSAQLIAYELPLGLGILGIILASGSLRLDTIIGQQAETGVWNIFAQPLGLIVFTVAAFAEAARLPFDLPEAEQELVGGYHTEFSGMKLVAFLTAEFLHMIAAAFLIVILFLGGWHFWFITGSGDEIGWLQAILRILVLAVKVLAVIFFFMLVRWSWPRFRFDQLMSLAWKVMLPLGLIHLVAVAVMGEISHNVRLGYAESLVGARLSQDEQGVVLRPAGGQDVAAPPSEDPASRPVSGLQVGDRLVAVGNRSVTQRDQVVRALVAHDPGDELTVRVERRGQEKEQTVRLGRPPPADAGLGAEYSSDYGSGMARSIGAISVTVQWLVAFAACAAFAILGAKLGDNRPRRDLQIHDIDDQL